MADEIKLTDQELVRRQKMADLKEAGVEPFGQAYNRTTNSGELREKYLSFFESKQYLTFLFFLFVNSSIKYFAK